MNILLIAALSISHILASFPFWHAISKRTMPRVVDFATIGIILYYDIGLYVQLFVHHNSYQFLNNFFNLDDMSIFKTFILMLLAPWSLLLGEYIATPFTRDMSKLRRYNIRSDRRIYFYLFIILLSITTLSISMLQVHEIKSLWVLRSNIANTLGSLVIILYLPLHVLAFYVQQVDARTKHGLVITTLLAVTAILATLPIGERTNFLLPLLIIFLFRNRLSFLKIVLSVLCCIILAAILLQSFKGRYSQSIDQQITDTIYNDFDRSATLATSYGLTIPFGSKILPYSMSGYIYSILFYLPRSIAPFKGESTAKYLTSAILSTPIQRLNWGLGIGLIEEAMLNIGYWFTLPLLVLYGFIMGIINRLSQRVPSTIVSTRLGAIWICGYHLPAVLLTFGTMTIITYFLHLIYSDDY